MSAKLSIYGTYLQDFIAKVKYLAASNLTAELEDSKTKKNEIMKPEVATKELNRQMDVAANDIRKADTLIPVLDNYCSVLPLIIRDISLHEEDDPPISFVLKNLVVGSLSGIISLFQMYFRLHYKIANFEKNDAVKDKFMSYRLLDYVRLLQILSWFVPVTPVFSSPNRKVYTELEPLFKAIESDLIYTTLESKTQKLSMYWRSQAERDLIHQGRALPE